MPVRAKIGAALPRDRLSATATTTTTTTAMKPHAGATTIAAVAPRMKGRPSEAEPSLPVLRVR